MDSGSRIAQYPLEDDERVGQRHALGGFERNTFREGHDSGKHTPSTSGPQNRCVTGFGHVLPVLEVCLSNGVLEEVIMLSVAEVRSIGLCSTCDNCPDCVYRVSRGADAQYCETFDCGNGASRAQTVTLVTRIEPQVREQTSLKGLCVNCENRDSCSLPKAESGIWHCEEYE